MINNLFNMKISCILAFTHSHLIISEQNMAKGDGTPLSDDPIKVKKMRDLGMKFINYCEEHNYTRDFLDTKIPHTLTPMASKYFGICKRVYEKKIGNTHAPIILSMIVFRKLSTDGLINGIFDEINECIDIFYESDILEKEEIQSKFKKDTTNTKHTEVLRYVDCVDSIFLEMNKKVKNKKRRKK